MTGRWTDLYRLGVFAALVTLVLVVACGSAASARSNRYRWPVAHPVYSPASLSHAGRRAARLRAPSLRARVAVVGGSQIAIAQAPWQVEVFIEFKSGKTIGCGGAILDSLHVVTAAHCTFDLETGERLAPSAFVVVGGTAHMTAEEIKSNPAVQARFVSTVRVHPMFEFSRGPGTSDDVAALTLKEPLSLDASVQGIQVAAATPGVEAGVKLTGFGRQDPGKESNRFLYSLAMTTRYSGRCGEEADAVFICASTTGGSGCNGDGGSGLTIGAPAELVGLLDTIEVVSGEKCRPGANNGFVNLTAPEIRGFLEGSESPPRAPRGGGIMLRGVPTVGHVLTCEPGIWTGAPTFTYLFVNSTNDQILQSGASSTYQLTATDIGRKIYCEVQAVNPGGTGVVRTTALSAIEAAPSPSSIVPEHTTTTEQSQTHPSAPSILSLVTTDVAVEQNGAAAVKLACAGSTSCSGTLTLQVKQSAKRKRGRRAARNVTIGTASYTIAAGATTSVTVHLNGTGRALLSTDHGRLVATLQIAQSGSGKTEAKAVRLVEKVSHAHKKRRK
jgi:hypothetical protein